MEFVSVNPSTGVEIARYDNHPPDLVETALAAAHAAHHTRSTRQGTASPHLISKPELEKGLNFLKMVVEATERGLGD